MRKICQKNSLQDNIQVDFTQRRITRIEASDLRRELLGSENFSSSTSFVLCDSDKLYYEEYVPRSRLHHKLAASDMAALAVKASSAMQEAAEEGGTRRRKTRISPVLELIAAEDETEGSEVKEKNIGNSGLERSGTVTQLLRNPSRRLKKTVRSFRVRLSTIHEGSTI